MKLPTFWGGIHPPQNKDLTADEKIEHYLPTGELVFPMPQNIAERARRREGRPRAGRHAARQQRRFRLSARAFERFRHCEGRDAAHDDAGDLRELRRRRERRPLREGARVAAAPGL